MSTLRSLQRKAIKNKCYKKNGNTKAFKNEWERIHYGKEVDKDGNVTMKTKKVEKPKQKHIDNGKAYMRHLKAMKSFVDNMKNQSKTTNAREKVC